MKLNLTIVLVFFLFITSFFVFFQTSSPNNPGYADSDEIITTGYLFSIPHPPGYSLQIILTKLFTLLPISLTIAKKANLLSAFLHSLTLSFLYLFSLNLLKILTNKNNLSTFEKIIPLFSALFFTFNFLFWLYSGIAEVFPFNNLLLIVTFFLALKWFQSVKNTSSSQTKYFFSTAFFFGLGVSHVQTFILLLPAFILFIILVLKNNHKLKSYSFKIFLALILGLIIFFLPYILLHFLNLQKNSVSWYFEPKLTALLKIIFRSDYAGFNPLSQLEYKSYFELPNLLKNNLKALFFYFINLVKHFSLPVFILIIFGFYFLFQKNKTLFYFFSLAYFFIGIFLAYYIGFPPKDNLDYYLSLGTQFRQYFSGYLILAVFINLGLFYLYKIIKLFFQKKSNTILCFLSILLIFNIIKNNYPLIKPLQNNFIHSYAKTVLKDLEPDSVIICFSDLTCMSLIYVQEVENFRTDIHILPQNFNIKKYYLEKNPGLNFFYYPDNPYYTCDLIAWNISQNRHVYLTNSIQLFSQKLGIEGDPFFLIPKKYLFQVVNQIPEKFPDTIDYSFSQNLIKTHIPQDNPTAYGQKAFFSYFHSVSAYLFHQLGEKDLAQKNFQLASSLNPFFINNQKQYNQFLLGQKSLNTNYQLGKKSLTSDQLIQKAQIYFSKRQYPKALNTYTKAVYSEPKNQAIREKLADLYFSLGYLMQAKREYLNILKLEPNNQKVQSKLNNFPKSYQSRYFLN